MLKQTKIDSPLSGHRARGEFVYHELVCYQHLHPGGFDVVDMHKNIGPAIIRQDEAKPAICIEELHPANWHA